MSPGFSRSSRERRPPILRNVSLDAEEAAALTVDPGPDLVDLVLHLREDARPEVHGVDAWRELEAKPSWCCPRDPGTRRSGGRRRCCTNREDAHAELRLVDDQQRACLQVN